MEEQTYERKEVSLRYYQFSFRRILTINTLQPNLQLEDSGPFSHYMVEREDAASIRAPRWSSEAQSTILRSTAARVDPKGQHKAT